MKKTVTLLILLALVITLLLPALPARADGPPDIEGQPQALHDAVNYAIARGYMAVYADGTFHPDIAATRAELAMAVVVQAGHGSENPDPNISFTDVPKNSPDFKWANLSVKYGLMDMLANNRFAPADPVPYERVVLAVETNLGMGDMIANINKINPAGPWYAGASVVFQDLGLKWEDTGVWPGYYYPRAELAYTLYTLDNLSSWKKDWVRSSFPADKCYPPVATPEQQTALNYAFERIGAPYVYAGESESEGGFDCSGFVYNTLSIRMGYPMQRVAADQLADENYLYVPIEGLKPGDVIGWYEGVGSTYVNHAGLYIGNGFFMHSTGTNGGVSINALTGDRVKRFANGRRVIGGPYPNNFDEYVLLYNPNNQAATATLSFLAAAGQAAQKQYTVGAQARYTVSVDDVMPYDEVSVSVASDQPLVAERAMYFSYKGIVTGGHAASGVTSTSTKWYLAEGYTGPGFETWLLLANPGNQAATVRVSFMPESGNVVQKDYSVGAKSRFTVPVNSIAGLGPTGVSMLAESTNGVGIVAERAIYFNDHRRADGSCAQGVTSPQNSWYFAEGYTGKGFDTYLLVQNPGAEDASIQVDLMGENPAQPAASYPFDVKAHSRFTVHVNDFLPGQGVSMKVQTLNGVPVVAERAVYFDYFGINGGHDSPGTVSPSNRWYFAEGCTANAFDTWLLLQNPGAEPAKVTVYFYRDDQRKFTREVTVPAGTRYTLQADLVAGLEAASFATEISSDQPIVAERSIYFIYKGRDGGTNSGGLQVPSVNWYFAEGYTGG